MSEIFIGTCSWVDKSLLESDEFYPKDVKSSEQRLRYYSSVFKTVEVDSSFYAIPSERNSKLWAVRTPDKFIFNFKAYGGMTGHSLEWGSIPKDLKSNILSGKNDRVIVKDKSLISEFFLRFKGAIKPIIEADKLGVVVFQYPPWFEKSSKNMDFILFAKEQMGDIRCAIEFRNRSWTPGNNALETLKFLRGNNLTYVISDAPQVDSQKTTEYLLETTTDIAYFRFHGRNKENWMKKGIDVSLRYDYEYNVNELKNFAIDIKTILTKVRKVFAMFNNHRGSQAVRNAAGLKNLLSDLD